MDNPMVWSNALRSLDINVGDGHDVRSEAYDLALSKMIDKFWKRTKQCEMVPGASGVHVLSEPDFCV